MQNQISSSQPRQIGREREGEQCHRTVVNHVEVKSKEIIIALRRPFPFRRLSNDLHALPHPFKDPSSLTLNEPRGDVNPTPVHRIRSMDMFAQRSRVSSMSPPMFVSPLSDRRTLRDARSSTMPKRRDRSSPHAAMALDDDQRRERRSVTTTGVRRSTEKRMQRDVPPMSIRRCRSTATNSMRSI
jgi:hypothetical protein